MAISHPGWRSAAVRRVVEESKNGKGLVPIPRHSTEANHARAPRRKPKFAMQARAVS